MANQDLTEEDQEVVVTQAMIEAGIEVLESVHGSYDSYQVVDLVYRTMRELALGHP